MKKYVELRVTLSGSLRNNIVPLTDLSKHVDPWKDCYRSVFYFDDNMLKYVAENGSVGKYPGKVGVDRIAWDLDSHPLEQAQKDAIKIVDRLVTSYGVKEEEISVAFSGRKGFGIEIKVEGIPYFDNLFTENVPLYIGHFCKEVAKDLTIDTSIYSKVFLYRIIGTLHDKESEVGGGNFQLFKTNISIKMLRDSTIEEIKKYCIEYRIPEVFPTISNSSKISKSLDNIINNFDKIIRELPICNTPTGGMLHEDLAPKGQKTCIVRLCQGTYTEGRDNALLRIADHEKKIGMPPEVVKAKLIGVLELMNKNDPRKAAIDPITDTDLNRLINQIFSGDYDYGCYDAVLHSQCSKKCYLASRKFKESTLDTVSLGEAYQRSKPFFNKYYENIALTGIKGIDESMPLFFGTFNLIVGKAGTGKTSIMLNILKNSIKQDIPTLFFSLDMSEEMLIQRFAPILLAQESKRLISGKEFMQAHARGFKDIINQADDEFSKASETVKISSKRGLTVSMIRDEIERQEALWGKKVKLAIIDYVQLLTSDKEGFANHTFNAEGITELAKDKKICILGLSQATGGYNDPNILAKGSRAWEEQTSTQVNCYRPFKDKYPEYDWTIVMVMAKNRLGPSDKVELFFHGPSGIVRDLTEEEKEVLIGLKDRLEYENE